MNSSGNSLANMANITTTVNPLLHNVTCSGPHIDAAGDTYTYILDDGFIRITTFLAVVNFLMIIPTVVINGAMLVGLAQQKKIRTISNRAFFTIAAADMLVGVLVDPILGAHIVQITQASHVCDLSNALVYLIPIFLLVTMVTHMIIALERFCIVRYKSFYTKNFTKRNVTIVMVFIWLLAFVGFLLPYLTGNPVLGTKVLGFLVLMSLGVCGYCYISLYQSHAWKDGRPTAKFETAFVIRAGVKKSDRTFEETEELTSDLSLATFFGKIYAFMLIFYLLYLCKGVLKGYQVFTGNRYFIAHFMMDTLLALHSLLNPCLIFYLREELLRAALLVLRRS